MDIKDLISNKGKPIKGPKLIFPKIFSDDRGIFYESWNKFNFNELFGETSFVQDNHSKSSRGVLRGLHYQIDPNAQGKLVRCTTGRVYDVLVDLRVKSITYSHWASVELNESNRKQIWIPRGFAHGFLTLTESAEVQYKTTNYWDPTLERSIKWNDIKLNISWPTYKLGGENIKLNFKDSNASTLEDALLKGEIFA